MIFTGLVFLFSCQGALIVSVCLALAHTNRAHAQQKSGARYKASDFLGIWNRKIGNGITRPIPFRTHTLHLVLYFMCVLSKNCLLRQSDENRQKLEWLLNDCAERRKHCAIKSVERDFKSCSTIFFLLYDMLPISMASWANSSHPAKQFEHTHTHISAAPFFFFSHTHTHSIVRFNLDFLEAASSLQPPSYRIFNYISQTLFTIAETINALRIWWCWCKYDGC